MDNKELDLAVGKTLAKELCKDCSVTLQQKITQKHIRKAVTPWGLKKLYSIIWNNTCVACQHKILVAGQKGATK